MLPNFLVVGAQKCATTSLHHYLSQHPDIYLPDGKETKFFVMDDRYEKGIDSYKENFKNITNQSVIGEVDPDYMYFKSALPRIVKHLNTNTLKIIFLLRNPVERAFSHYLMTYRRGLESESFSNALYLECDRIKKDFLSRMHYSYADRGFYLKQIKRFEEFFDKTQMYFILTDDLKFKREETLKKCFKFLDVDGDFQGYEKKRSYHKGQIPRSKFLLNSIVNRKDTLIKKIVRFVIPNEGLRKNIRSQIITINEKDNNLQMDEKTKKYLNGIYKDENKALSEYINQDLDFWNN